jgi:hypothetical protein
MEMSWKEVVVSFFKVLSQNFHGGTEENNGSPQSNESLYWDSNLRPPKYQAEVGTTQL